MIVILGLPILTENCAMNLGEYGSPPHSFFNQVRRRPKTMIDHLFPELFLLRGLCCYSRNFLIKDKSILSCIFLLCELIILLLISFQVLSSCFLPTLSLNLRISQLGLPCMGSQRSMAQKLLLITSIWTSMKDILLHCWGPMELGKLLQCMLLVNTYGHASILFNISSFLS